MLVAAAEPVGDSMVVWRAAERLVIPALAATAAQVHGLLQIGARVRFRHPLVRSAVYSAAPVPERRAARTVAPFGPNRVGSCTVKAGTKIFLAVSSSECSTLEGNGTTEAELRACAEQSDVQTAPSVTVNATPCR
jgi:hypothetical protein